MLFIFFKMNCCTSKKKYTDLGDIDLKTGDIVLFNEDPRCGSIFVLIDWAIRCWTGSPYSHAGLVVVDPPWPCGEGKLKGTYIWDSSQHIHEDPCDGKIKFGIALVPIDQYIHDANEKHQKLYKRSPADPNTYGLFSDTAIQKLHTKVYGKPYDNSFSHWWAGMWHILIPRTASRFWCSAFVSYALTEVGVFKEDTDWSVISPADLSSQTKNPYMKNRWRHAYKKDELFSEF